ncbi:unnamed protein product [Lactuca virosa]|uniref:Sodium/metabolite cotransporter BASS5, chloroplastic n=1 Tax=Lactuca virosa TaxID=75947 RepID=A0AAU9PVS8_9ASTR|nr:unnamed protein product [Lactuca virosa]
MESIRQLLVHVAQGFLMILRSSVAQLHHHHHHHQQQRYNQLSCAVPRKSSSENSRIAFPISPHTLSLCWGSRLIVHRRVSGEFPDKIDQDEPPTYAPISPQILEHNTRFVDVLKKANSILPQVVLASTILALVFPPSFTWFTSRYYAPALGFLMFAVGLNSSEKDFIEAFNRPTAIFAGYIGQFVLKPFLGYLFGTMAMTIFGLPTSLGVGIMLTSCVSGAQLSNYATFLTDPMMAPLSIVMTSLSTATAVFVTPLLSLLLIGKRLPVDVKGMVSNILQIVVSPVAAGLLLNRFLPKISSAIRPFLPPLSVLVTSLCVGAPLAININSVLSPFGISVLLVVIALHFSAFVLGYTFTGIAFHNSPDVKPLQRTLSYETGMQSSLLALALANKFFQDPLVGVPPAISVVIMSLMGFSLVMIWGKKKKV